MIYTYWTANARDAEEGRNVFAAGRGQDPDRPAVQRAADDPAVRPGFPRLETCPSSGPSTPRTRASWTFDVGTPIDGDPWIDRGCCTS